MYHPHHIANAFQKYYKNLYNLKDEHRTFQPTKPLINEFLSSVSLPSLTKEALLELNASITEEEIHNVIKTLANNKSPVADGFTAEYYKTYQDTLVPHPTKVFNYTASSASFPPEMLQATIITLTDNPQTFVRYPF